LATAHTNYTPLLDPSHRVVPTPPILCSLLCISKTFLFAPRCERFSLTIPVGLPWE